MYILTQERSGYLSGSRPTLGYLLGAAMPEAQPQVAKKAFEIIGGFGFNRSELPQGERPKIDRIARQILSVGLRAVSLVGHTDPVGTPVYNQQLGQRRADEVVRHLRAALDRIRTGSSQQMAMVAVSAGATQPRSTVHAENRRVEAFLPPVPPPSPLQPALRRPARRPKSPLAQHDPFPNIKKHCLWEYRKAMDAFAAYKKVESFARFYHPLLAAATAARLDLGPGNALLIEPEKDSFLNLLGEEVASEITEEIAEKLAARLFDERVGRYFGIYDLLDKFAAIVQGERNARLFKEQDGSMSQQAFRKKLLFFMDIQARLLARQDKDPRKTEVWWKNWLVYQYRRFEEADNTLSHYQFMEETDCGKFEHPPRFTRPNR